MTDNNTPPMKEAPSSTEPNQGGRPTKYQPEFCDRIIDLGTQGMGICEIAVELGVVRQTIYSWKDQHSEFLDAFTRAREKSQAWWERQGREGLSSREFNHGLWKLNMVNRFPKDWSDKQKVEHANSPNPLLMEMVKEAQMAT